MNKLSRNVWYTLAVLCTAAWITVAAAKAAASGGVLATYTVTAPVTGYSLVAGSTAPVTWTSSAPGSNNINISLVDISAWVVVDEIAASTADDGSESYTFPASLPAGPYLIYIEDVGQTSWTYGSEFQVLECGTQLNTQLARSDERGDRSRPMPRDRRVLKIPAPDPEQ